MCRKKNQRPHMSWLGLPTFPEEMEEERKDGSKC